jgi:Ca2+/Na+ antiporter
MGECEEAYGFLPCSTSLGVRISLTFSQVYGAVTMNNTLCLGIFLVIVSIKLLQWTYTSEVLVIIAATLAVGLAGILMPTIRSYWAFPALLIYPLAIIGVYVGDNVLHLD